MKIRCSVGKGTMEAEECLACTLKNVLPPCGFEHSEVRRTVLVNRLCRQLEMELGEYLTPVFHKTNFVMLFYQERGELCSGGVSPSNQDVHDDQSC